MKIEMGESLFYSWLRQVKECQMAQTNWKTSPNWILQHKSELETMFDELRTYFGPGLFGKTVSLDQLLKQGECDALGMHIDGTGRKLYAVDVAFHEKGLNYGSKNETILKVVAKYIRSAFCLYGYFDAKEGEILFASPKISQGIYDEVKKHIAYLDGYFASKGLSFVFELVGNGDFGTLLFTTLASVTDASDTSELLARAYKLIEMFSAKPGKKGKKTATPHPFITVSAPSAAISSGVKVGVLARTVLKDILENGTVPNGEITDLQTKAYCKSVLGLNHPLLVTDRNATNKGFYYAEALTIKGKKYYMCNDWYERQRNQLQAWIDSHP